MPVKTARLLIKAEDGQSVIVVALAITALVGLIGLAVDVGMLYVERGQLLRGLDAAALAGAQELPKEKAAHQRALEYLAANGYDIDSACIETHGSDLGGLLGSCQNSEAATIIVIDTYDYRDNVVPNENTANRINVWAQQVVPTNFVRAIGIAKVPIVASATAENVEDLDIALVFDRSGSMQGDTICYGCWELDPDVGYRAGSIFPLPYGNHCSASSPLYYPGAGGYAYLSIEAEHYSSYLVAADYHRNNSEWPKIWWAMQRQPGKNASGPDARGAFMKVGPHMDMAMHYNSIGDIVYPPELLTTPRLDYDFTVPETITSTFYVWIRAQGGAASWDNAATRRRIYVGLNGVPLATGETPLHGPYNDGADGNNWAWSRVLQAPGLVKGDAHTLNVWAAGPGFSLDKIVITNDPRTDLDTNDHPLDWSYNGIDDGGPGQTRGRTGWACMPDLDPRFAPYDPVTGDLDDLYDDFQPIRAAKEAAKNFIGRLNTRADQISYVTYGSGATIVAELYCIKQGLVCDVFDSISAAVESTTAGGGTDTAAGMWDGIRVLTTGREPNFDPSGVGYPPKEPGRLHFGRPNAARVMILMTDGVPTGYPALPAGYGDCYSDDLWPDQPDESINERLARDCVVWFAHQARDQGIVIYTIGLGKQADHELLAHVAELTFGWYYYAPSADDLDDVFSSLYERNILRLTE